MKFSISASEYRTLSHAVFKALYEALKTTAPPEPQLVANLVSEIPKEINALGSLSGYKIQSGGVFVHGQPFVKCPCFPETKPASVEIGDILLVRSEVSRGKVIGRRALLLQAKKASSLPTKPDNKNQHHLYAKWPSFEYVRSGPELNGKKRNITGLDLHDATRYLLIFDSTPPKHSFCCGSLYPFHLGRCLAATASPTEPAISHYRCFATELIDFLLGDAGKSFLSPPPKRKRNWDKVIDDLIHSTAKRESAFVGRAITPSAKRAPRGRGILFAMMPDCEVSAYSVFNGVVKSEEIPSLDGGDEPPFRDNIEEENDENGGISVIEFIVESENSRD